MSKEDVIEVEGVVIEALPNANFKVKLSNGHFITCVHFRKAEDELHQDTAGGHRDFGDQPIRPYQGPHYLEKQESNL